MATRTIALVVMVLWAVPAAAQDRLFAGTREIGAFGHFGADLGPAPAWLGFPRFGGDRYVHVFGRGVVDLRTDATLPLGEGFPVAYDRARPHVFLLREDGVWLQDVRTSWSLLVLPGSTAGLTACIHATSADVLFCALARPDGQHDIVRPGLFGYQTVATTRFAGTYPVNWVVTPDASRLYLAHCARATGGPPSVCLEADIAAIDPDTGVTITAGYFDALSPPGSLVWDEVNDRLFTVGSRIDVFTKDLVPIGAATTGGRGRSLVVSPHTGRVYLDVSDYYFSSQWATLTAYDAATYRVLEPGLRRTTATGAPLTLLTAPGAPRDVRAWVQGHTVDLNWTNIGGASGFVLDMGFAPGRTDLSVPLGPAPRASFANVPPGTYYLRLRGGNEHGGGRPSRELAVTVR